MTAQPNPHPDALLRVWDIIGRPAKGDRPAIPALIPVGKTAWWTGVKQGRFPQPVRLSSKCTMPARRSDIQRLIDGAVGEAAANESADQGGAS